MQRLNANTLLIILMSLLLGTTSGFAQEVRPRQRLQGRFQPEVLYLTPEQETGVIEYLREHHPETVENLLKLKEFDQESYRGRLSRAYREMQFLKNLKEKDPEQYKRVSEEKRLEIKSRMLARQYRRSSNEDERAEIRVQLENLLYKLFDYRQMNRKDEIDRLEKRLAELKEEIQKRLNNKDSIVQYKLSDMLSEKKELDW